MDKLEICRRTRMSAIRALEETLKEVVALNEKVSESEFRDRWLEKLRENSDIYPNGWYTPPPNGIGVVFGGEEKPERLAFKSLRLEENWPREDVFLDRKMGVAFVYASPVDKGTAIMGDIGVGLYFGKDPRIIEHIKLTYQKIIPQIFEFANIGVELREVYERGMKVFEKNGAFNNWWIAINDPTGGNSGHTISATGEDWSDEEREILESDAPWQEKATVISKKRKFVNSAEKTKLRQGMAITIEQGSKLTKYPDLPVQWFHTMAFFHEDGNKELVIGYDEIFKIAGMDYLL